MRLLDRGRTGAVLGRRHGLSALREFHLLLVGECGRCGNYGHRGRGGDDGLGLADPIRRCFVAGVHRPLGPPPDAGVRCLPRACAGARGSRSFRRRGAEFRRRRGKGRGCRVRRRRGAEDRGSRQALANAGGVRGGPDPAVPLAGAPGVGRHRRCRIAGRALLRREHVVRCADGAAWHALVEGADREPHHQAHRFRAQVARRSDCRRLWRRPSHLCQRHINHVVGLARVHPHDFPTGQHTHALLHLHRFRSALDYADALSLRRGVVPDTHPRYGLGNHMEHIAVDFRRHWDRAR
mmetsp:Transcript_91034/g.262217  ORF Transcript_91034/g.262217 Transcript_91034/m.262217 type:complete len:294 (-) Transcript_91034:496-1377(-)